MAPTPPSTMHPSLPLHLSEAMRAYDGWVEELSATPTAAPDRAMTTMMMDALLALCRMLLQVHAQDDQLFSVAQVDIIRQTLCHVEHRLACDRPEQGVEEEGVGGRHEEPSITWDRARFTIHGADDIYHNDSDNDDDDDDDDDGMIHMCWTDRKELEQEEAMLVAMASTPIPSEMLDQTIVDPSTRSHKRHIDCLVPDEI